MKLVIPQDQPQPNQPRQGDLISGFKWESSKEVIGEGLSGREAKIRALYPLRVLWGLSCEPTPQWSASSGDSESAACLPSPAAALCLWLSSVLSSKMQTSLELWSLFPHQPISPGMVLGQCGVCRLWGVSIIGCQVKPSLSTPASPSLFIFKIPLSLRRSFEQIGADRH